MIVAFGPQAGRYVQGLPDLEAVVTEIAAIGEAYLEAVRRREAGTPFYGMVLTDDSRVSFGYRHTEQILAQVKDYDRRRIVLDQLALGKLPINRTPAETLWGSDPVMEGIVVEFLALADAVLVRSHAEGTRVNAMFARAPVRRLPPPIVRVLAASVVPAVERVRPESPAVVVWAPHRPAIETALHLHGLAEFHGEVTCVSAGGARPSHATAAFAAPGDPQVGDALRTAAGVVCVEPSDPSDAVAFARLGYGVVAPVGTGAHEFAGDVVTWDALNARFLHTAVAVAVARPASMRSEPPQPPQTPRVAAPAFVAPGARPLVSIVVPVGAPPGNPAAVLASLAAQTYANVEAIVVNASGASLAALVAPFGFARVLDVPAGTDPERAIALGRADARGDYIGVLADEGRFFPDHLERLVDVLLRSGAAVAYGAAVLRFLERDSAGEWQTTGFNNRAFAHAVANGRLHQMLATRGAGSDASALVPAFVNRVTSEVHDRGGDAEPSQFPATIRIAR